MSASRGSPRARGAAWLLVALVACACGERPRGAPPAPEPEPLAPPVPVAGMPGLQVRSQVTFFAAPEVPHELVCTYVFPDRARWWLGVGSGANVRRVLHSRHGERCFFTPEASAQSVERHGREREEQLRQMELRRALFLWPDGFTWAGQESVRRSDLGAIGILQARLDREGRLVELVSLDREGQPVDTYGGLRWMEQGGRTYPAAAELSHGGQPIWKEEVRSIETDVHLFDDFFLPPDRRETHRAGSQRLEGVEPADAPTAVERRLPLELPGDAPWSAVMAAAESLRAAQAQRLEPTGYRILATPIFELGDDGGPRAVILRLARAMASPPEGWSVRLAGPALTRRVAGPGELATAVAALRGSLPASARAAAPWVEAPAPGSGDGPLLVVQPILPGD